MLHQKSQVTTVVYMNIAFGSVLQFPELNLNAFPPSEALYNPHEFSAPQDDNNNEPLQWAPAYLD